MSGHRPAPAERRCREQVTWCVARHFSIDFRSALQMRIAARRSRIEDVQRIGESPAQEGVWARYTRLPACSYRSREVFAADVACLEGPSSLCGSSIVAQLRVIQYISIDFHGESDFQQRVPESR